MNRFIDITTIHCKYVLKPTIQYFFQMIKSQKIFKSLEENVCVFYGFRIVEFVNFNYLIGTVHKLRNH